MLVLIAVFAPITTIATLLRFAARAQKKLSLGFDDLFALLALLSFCAFLGVCFWGESRYSIHDGVKMDELTKMVIAEKVFHSAGVGTPHFSLSRLSLYLKVCLYFWSSCFFQANFIRDTGLEVFCLLVHSAVQKSVFFFCTIDSSAMIRP